MNDHVIIRKGLKVSEEYKKKETTLIKNILKYKNNIFTVHQHLYIHLQMINACAFIDRIVNMVKLTCVGLVTDMSNTTYSYTHTHI